MMQDFCKFIKDCADNPAQMIDGMTVRYYNELVLHIEGCDECQANVMRGAGKDDREIPPFMSKN